jgi:3-hydroxybutyryl-CoA dehydrogenase
MGGGIALSFALAGSRVGLMSRTHGTIDRARMRIAESLALLQEVDGLLEADAARVSSRIRTTTSLPECVRDARLVVESVPERLTDKIEVLRQAEELVDRDAILTTDTSSLPVETIGEALARPQTFAGLHWFNPAEFVRLVEVVPVAATSPETVDSLRRWMEAVGHTAIQAGPVPGFVANRLQYALLREAFALVESRVCTYEDVDLAIRTGLGPRWAAVGPFESLDLAGLDVHLAVAEQLYQHLSNATVPFQIVEELVERGALGCKTGEGIYGDYTQERVQELVRRRDLMLLAIRNVIDSRPSRDRE